MDGSYKIEDSETFNRLMTTLETILMDNLQRITDAQIIRMLISPFHYLCLLEGSLLNQLNSRSAHAIRSSLNVIASVLGSVMESSSRVPGVLSGFLTMNSSQETLASLIMFFSLLFSEQSNSVNSLITSDCLPFKKLFIEITSHSKLLEITDSLKEVVPSLVNHSWGEGWYSPFFLCPETITLTDHFYRSSSWILLSCGWIEYFKRKSMSIQSDSPTTEEIRTK